MTASTTPSEGNSVGDSNPDSDVVGISVEGVMAAIDLALKDALLGEPGSGSEALAALQVVAEVEARLSERRFQLAATVFYEHAEADSRACSAAACEGRVGISSIGPGRVDPMDTARSEIGAALTLAPSVAGDLVDTGRLLCEHFPLVGESLAEGKIDERTARLLMRELAECPEGSSSLLEEEALHWASGSPAVRVRGQRLAGRIRRRLVEIDPEAIRERRQRVLARRRVSIRSLPDGLARIDAVVSAEAGRLIDTALDKLAHRSAKVETPLEGQSLGDRRAAHGRRRCDALVALCAEAFLPAAERGDGPLVGVTAIEYVVQQAPSPAALAHAPASLARWLMGHGWVPGTGVAAEESVSTEHRAAAMGDVGADYQPLRPVAVTVPIDPHESYDWEARWRYKIPDKLARLVRLRDATCVFPGCEEPSVRCDLDHIQPFNHADPTRGGPTVEEQLVPECRLHHRLKTHASWTVERRPEQGLTFITSPAGARYAAKSEGPLGRQITAQHLSRGFASGFAS